MDIDEFDEKDIICGNCVEQAMSGHDKNAIDQLRLIPDLLNIQHSIKYGCGYLGVASPRSLLYNYDTITIMVKSREVFSCVSYDTLRWSLR